MDSSSDLAAHHSWQRAGWSMCVCGSLPAACRPPAGQWRCGPMLLQPGLANRPPVRQTGQQEGQEALAGLWQFGVAGMHRRVLFPANPPPGRAERSRLRAKGRHPVVFAQVLPPNVHLSSNVSPATCPDSAGYAGARTRQASAGSAFSAAGRYHRKARREAQRARLPRFFRAAERRRRRRQRLLLSNRPGSSKKCV